MRRIFALSRAQRHGTLNSNARSNARMLPRTRECSLGARERWRPMVTRREFIDTLAAGAAGLAISSSAKSYGQIMGSNERLNFAVIGLNSRAYAHLSALHANK